MMFEAFGFMHWVALQTPISATFERKARSSDYPHPHPHLLLFLLFPSCHLPPHTYILTIFILSTLPAQIHQPMSREAAAGRVPRDGGEQDAHDAHEQLDGQLPPRAQLRAELGQLELGRRVGERERGEWRERERERGEWQWERERGQSERGGPRRVRAPGWRCGARRARRPQHPPRMKGPGQIAVHMTGDGPPSLCVFATRRTPPPPFVFVLSLPTCSAPPRY
ncbi:hypothetical protein JB92DRAFT_1685350 [Gautieria morchelliformis]|nr:hypothetical protein JB92DRAFT_1685350 [Gautieria morchelliformis]